MLIHFELNYNLQSLAINRLQLIIMKEGSIGALLVASTS